MSDYKYQATDIFDLCRKLSIDDVEMIINTFSDHIMAFNEQTGQLWSVVEFAYPNGSAIQINFMDGAPHLRSTDNA